MSVGARPLKDSTRGKPEHRWKEVSFLFHRFNSRTAFVTSLAEKEGGHPKGPAEMLNAMLFSGISVGAGASNPDGWRTTWGNP